MNDKVEAKSTKKGRSKGYQSKYPLPSEACSLQRMLQILKNIVQAAKEKDEYRLIDTSKVINETGEIRTDVSRYLLFFSQAGLIEQAGKGKPFKPTEEAVEFANVEQWAPDEAKAALRKAFENKWFTSVVNSALKEGKILTREELVSRLGRASSADGSPKVLKKLERLVDLLRYAECISEDPETNKIRLIIAPAVPIVAEEEAIQKEEMRERPPEEGNPVVDQQWGEKSNRVRLLVFSKEPLKPEVFRMIADISEQIDKLATFLCRSEE